MLTKLRITVIVLVLSTVAHAADSVRNDGGIVTWGNPSGTLDANRTAEVTLASAATTDLGAQTSQNIQITGTTTITSFGTAGAGIVRRVRFSGALTLTHNATSLILPGGRNITTAAGDSFIAVSLGSGNWVVYSYLRATGHTPSVITSNQTYDPGSLTTTSVEVQTWTVSGVAAGDCVVVGHPSITAPTTSAYWDFRGFATATDTVVTRLQNNTGGTVDLASGTMTIRVIK